jgi:hypothetical protein
MKRILNFTFFSLRKSGDYNELGHKRIAEYILLNKF